VTAVRKDRGVSRTILFYALAGILLLVGPTGCAGDSSNNVAAESIVASPLDLIDQKDFAKTKVGSPERAFLRYWSALQHSAWSEALAFYNPRLLDAIGITPFVGALSFEVAYFRAVKPKITEGRRVGGEYRRVGGEYIIHYLVPEKVGSRRVSPQSIAWRRIGGAWRIYYQASLDELLRRNAQFVAQTNINALAQTPSPAAIRAGAIAGRAQSRYLEREIERRR